MPTYGWGANEPDISPVAEGGDTIATFATKITNAIGSTFDTLNTFPWANATQSSAGFMSSDDKKAVDGIEDLGTFNKMFFSQTSGNYTAPRTGVYRITLKGGGGGGGGTTSATALGGAGGEGGLMTFYATLTKLTAYAYTIGAGGPAGENGPPDTTGTDGGTTSITIGGDTYSASGGMRGVRAGVSGAPGIGGATFAQNGKVCYCVPGAAGGAGGACASGARAPSGGGAGGGAQSNSSTNGSYGGGGHGGSTASPATSGGDGYILIEYAE